MTRRRPIAPPTGDGARLVAELADRARALGRRCGPLTVPPGRDPFTRRADALDAGHPVELDGWQLPAWARDAGQLDQWDRVTVGGDGALDPRTLSRRARDQP